MNFKSIFSSVIPSLLCFTNIIFGSTENHFLQANPLENQLHYIFNLDKYHYYQKQLEQNSYQFNYRGVISAPADSRPPSITTDATGPKEKATAEFAFTNMTLIPFASGTPINVTTFTEGASENGTIVSFGSCITNVNVTGDIDITGNENLAFSMPFEGILTSLAAYFYLTEASIPNPFGKLTLVARIYQAKKLSNVFTPVKGTKLNIDFDTNILLPGLVLFKARDLEVPIKKRTRLLLVFSITDGAGDVAISVSGFASAGLQIVPSM